MYSGYIGRCYQGLRFYFFVRKYGITVCIRDILVGVIKDLGFIFLYVNTVSLYVFGIYW